MIHIHINGKSSYSDLSDEVRDLFHEAVRQAVNEDIAGKTGDMDFDIADAEYPYEVEVNITYELDETEKELIDWQDVVDATFDEPKDPNQLEMFDSSDIDQLNKTLLEHADEDFLPLDN